MSFNLATLGAAIRTCRPQQWVKNGFVLAPAVFARELFDAPIVLRALLAALLFSLASSSVYVVNDLADAESDRRHPAKRNRPIASGALPASTAKGLAAFLAIAGVGGACLINASLGAVVMGYLVLNTLYTFKVKRIAYLDVMSIAAGFELRVLGGSVATDIEPSSYLLAVTVFLACFLGFGKRMHELTSGPQIDLPKGGGNVAIGEADTASRRVRVFLRQSLKGYHLPVLRILLAFTGAGTVLLYAMYTLDPYVRDMFGTDWLFATTPFTAFGIVRFVVLIHGNPSVESPTEQMLRDWPFILNFLAWSTLILGLVYLA